MNRRFWIVGISVVFLALPAKSAEKISLTHPVMKRRPQNLATQTHARQFLSELANLDLAVVQRLGTEVDNAFAIAPANFEEAKKRGRIREDEEKAFQRFMDRFRTMLPDQIADEEQEGRAAHRLRQLQQWVQAVWKEPDPRSRIFRVFRIVDGLRNLPDNQYGVRIPRFLFADDDFPTPESFVPTYTPFESILLNLTRASTDSDLAKVCANPNCPAPYFFAVRRTQKFCSSICAAPAQREAKLR